MASERVCSDGGFEWFMGETYLLSNDIAATE
jgi:hypothetical protein